MAVAVPTTELDAVNEMLTAIGVTPVNTLEVSGLTDAAIALDTLRRISKEVQSQGWWFNSDRAVQYTPSGGTITVPPTILSIRPTFGTYNVAPETVHFVLRNNVLWDTRANANVSQTIRADVIREIEFESLPESTRRYATVRAARVFQTKVLGDEALGVFTETHEQEAWDTLEGDQGINAPESSLFMRRVRAVAAQFRPDPQRMQQQRQRGN